MSINTEEFTAYGDKSNQVKKMVNNNNVGVCTKFYSHRSKLVSSFKTNFFKEYDSYDLSETKIIPIFIELYDMNDEVPAGNHAVLLVQDKGTRYLFDPNGVVDGDSRYVYYDSSKDHIYESDALTYHFNVNTPLTKGVQQLSPGDVDTKYISEGGYCMFYVRQALNYLVQEKEKKKSIDLTQLAHKLSQRKFYNSKESPFSIRKKIEKKSVELVNMYL